MAASSKFVPMTAGLYGNIQRGGDVGGQLGDEYIGRAERFDFRGRWGDHLHQAVVQHAGDLVHIRSRLLTIQVGHQDLFDDFPTPCGDNLHADIQTTGGGEYRKCKRSFTDVIDSFQQLCLGVRAQHPSQQDQKLIGFLDRIVEIFLFYFTQRGDQQADNHLNIGWISIPISGGILRAYP